MPFGHLRGEAGCPRIERSHAILFSVDKPLIHFKQNLCHLRTENTLYSGSLGGTQTVYAEYAPEYILNAALVHHRARVHHGVGVLALGLVGQVLHVGLVNDGDLIAALESGKVACYATDFPNNRLLAAPHVAALPHLGASTPESEDNCAVMAADELKDYLEN